MHVSAVTVSLVQAIGRAFRTRPELALLLLIKDYEMLDFVLLDRTEEATNARRQDNCCGCAEMDQFADACQDLKVLAPVLGSGHFLVEKFMRNRSLARRPALAHLRLAAAACRSLAAHQRGFCIPG